MAGATPRVVTRRLPDAWADYCPTCRNRRRWLSLRIWMGRRFMGELIEPWCDTCTDTEEP